MRLRGSHLESLVIARDVAGALFREVIVFTVDLTVSVLQAYQKSRRLHEGVLVRIKINHHDFSSHSILGIIVERTEGSNWASQPTWTILTRGELRKCTINEIEIVRKRGRDS